MSKLHAPRDTRPRPGSTLVWRRPTLPPPPPPGAARRLADVLAELAAYRNELAAELERVCRLLDTPLGD